MIRQLICGIALTFAPIWAQPTNPHWPQFRGPGGLGLGDDKASLPAEFGPAKALRWKTELPLGHGSPCIWGDRIFVTAFDPANKKLEVIALHRKNGRIAWRQPIPAAEIEKVHATSSPATSTPVTDGKLVYVYSGSYGLLAYTPAGKLAWQHPLGVAQSPYGSGTSPVLAGDLVLLARDYAPKPFLLAVRKSDGKVAWKSELPAATQLGPRTAHSTPVVWKDQIVLNRPGDVSAFSVRDGARLWWFPTVSQGTASPAAGRDVVYITAPNFGADTFTLPQLPPFAAALEKYDRDKDGKLSPPELPENDLFIMKRGGVGDETAGAHFTIKGFFGMFDANKDGSIDEAEYNRIGPGIASVGKTATASGVLSVRPLGEGALPPSALQWSEPRGAPEVTTPLEYRGRLYLVNSGGVISCLQADTGKVIYRGRVNAPGIYFASPVAGGGKVFVASAEGVVTVLGGGEKLEVLANNDLGDPVYGTPALVGSAVYVRSHKYLWAFGGK